MQRFWTSLYIFAVCSTFAAPASATEILLFRNTPPTDVTRAFIDRFRAHPDLSRAGIVIVETDLRGNVRQLLNSDQPSLALVLLDRLVSTGLVQNSPLVSTFMQPGQFPDDSALYKAQDLALGEALLAEVGREGSLVPVGYWSRGQTTVFSRVAIRSVDDLRGRNIHSALSAAADAPVNALGATSLHFPSGVLAAQAGAVEAAETTQDVAVTVAESASASEFKTALTNYRPYVGLLVAGSRGWDRLKEAEKAALATAAKAADTAARDATAQVSKGLEATLQSRGISLVSLASSDPTNLKQANTTFLTTQFGQANLAGISRIQTNRDFAVAVRSDTSTPRSQMPTIRRANAPALFVTNRIDEHGSDPATRFASKAADVQELVCGQVGYILPTTRDVGSEYTDPITLGPSVLPTGSKACIDFIADVLQKNGRSRVLLFIHGFNNTFEFALRRAIAMSDDIGFDGVVLVWSWPAEGRAQAYWRDETTAARTSRIVPPFVMALMARPQVKRLDVLAHSMGSRIARVLLDELRKAQVSSPAPANLGTIVFAAADEDRGVFADVIRDVVHDTSKLGRIRTIYAAKYDQPLQISALLHKDDRVGVGGKNIMVGEGIESIDATDVEGGFWGAFIRSSHSHVFDVPKAIEDLKRLLSSDRPAAQRALTEHVDAKGGKYWSIP